MMSTYRNILLIVTILGMCVLAGYMQYMGTVNLDTANALHEAKLLFAGGKYFYDFYETSPPMFLYAYFPLVELLKYFSSIKFATGIYAYFLFLSLFSMGLCYILSKKLLVDQENKLTALLLGIGLIFILFGINYFGQREQIALVLTTPYFLLLALRLEQKQVKTYLYIITAVLAGIGFATKPHFCIPFFLAEFYFVIKNKRFLALFRIESVIVVSIFIIYLISTYLLYPAYFKIIVPLSTRFYYFGIHSDPFWKDFFTIKMGYCYISILLYLLARKDNIRNIALINIFFIAVVGYVFSYLSQIAPWDYHLFPAFGFASILNIFLLYSFALQKSNSRLKIFFYILFSFAVYLFNTLYIGVHSLFFVFILVFCLSFYLKRYFLSNIIGVISAISLSALIFSYPIFVTYAMYHSQNNIKKIMQPLIHFLHRNAYKKPVYFFSAILLSEYPSVDYAGAIHCSRFPYLLWLPAYMKAITENKHDKSAAEIYGMNIFFTKLLAQDIALKKPKFILVDSSKYINTPIVAYTNFSYLKLFNKSPEFKKVWENYHYFKTVSDANHYTFKVYEINKFSKK